jgi:hypothetical protein
VSQLMVCHDYRFVPSHMTEDLIHLSPFQFLPNVVCRVWTQCEPSVLFSMFSSSLQLSRRRSCVAPAKPYSFSKILPLYFSFIHRLGRSLI